MEELKEKVKYCSECGCELTLTAKYCSNCGAHVLPVKFEEKETQKKKGNLVKNIILNFIIIICIISVVILGIDLGFRYTGNEEKLNEIIAKINNALPFNSFKKTILTSENYEEVSNQLADNLEEDEMYYYTYATMYYMAQDGFSNLFDLAEDESLMYQNIYNKTINQLINEGISLMEENHITLEEYKRSLENFAEEN